MAKWPAEKSFKAGVHITSGWRQQARSRYSWRALSFEKSVTASTALFMAVVSFCLCGCSHSFNPSVKSGLVRPVQGRIRVVTVEPWINSAIVRFRGRRCMAWWDRYSAFYTGGHLQHQLPNVTGIRYHFDGLQTDRDIYLGQVWRQKPPFQFNGFPSRRVPYGLHKQHPPGQTTISVTPVGGGLKLPRSKSGNYPEPGKQRKIPLPIQLGS
jgi:hypothetical protein